MNYILMKDNSIRLDLIVDREFLPQMVGYVTRMGCTYTEEKQIEGIKGRDYVLLRDIQGPTCASVGELLGLFYSLEWGSVTKGGDGRKFYIMLNSRRKGRKKNADKDRKEAGKGSHCGDHGEPSGNSGSEPLGGPAGNGTYIGDPGDDDLWELPRVE